MDRTMVVGGGYRMPVTCWRRGGVPEHPLLTAAQRVETLTRYGRVWPGYVSEAEAARRRRWQSLGDSVRLPATEHDVVPEAAGTLFEGITRARARLLRDTLCGYPVRFWSANDRLFRRPVVGTLGVFYTIHLEGDWATGIEAPYDIVIHTSWEERETGPACGGGVSRIMGLGVPTRIDVLSMDPWGMCGQCGCWRPRRCLRDYSRWMLDDPEFRDEYRLRLECSQSEEGYCL